MKRCLITSLGVEKTFTERGEGIRILLVGKMDQLEKASFDKISQAPWGGFGVIGNFVGSLRGKRLPWYHRGL